MRVFGTEHVEGGNTVVLKVSGMTCAACSTHVERELRSVPGVLSAHVRYDDGIAEVQVVDSDGPTLTSLTAAVERAGYSTSLPDQEQ